MGHTTELVVRTRFEAAHRLAWHPGRCRNLHGHSYRLDVMVGGPLDGNGIIADFADVKAAVRAAVVDVFDHSLLNDFLDNPTAELVAADIADRLDRHGVSFTELWLWETADSGVRVKRE